jgi:hypothetical protein
MEHFGPGAVVGPGPSCLFATYIGGSWRFCAALNDRLLIEFQPLAGCRFLSSARSHTSVVFDGRFKLAASRLRIRLSAC